jgi:hypothetical protein
MADPHVITAPLPVPADRLAERERQGAVDQSAVVRPTVILIPGRMGGILVKVLRAHEMMLPLHHATKAAEIALGWFVQVSSE